MAWNEQYGHLFVRGFLKASHSLVCEKEVASCSVFKLRELCKLHDNLMPLSESDGNVFFSCFVMKQKFYEPRFGDHIFPFGD